ncbi:hypothetical protein CEXT_234111 [Caerostris extrusa]|uniref:Uncharacterized protein n=1 Tax=Caerostris extrusa TaxID=172846 RepID=A0AAV4X456_CAEEX|nr:hypothetical protein CEXT_234111 [Caerostris extrusa]
MDHRIIFGHNHGPQNLFGHNHGPQNLFGHNHGPQNLFGHDHESYNLFGHERRFDKGPIVDGLQNRGVLKQFTVTWVIVDPFRTKLHPSLVLRTAEEHRGISDKEIIFDLKE